MKVLIEINCDNDAFGDTPYREVSRILDSLGDKIGEFHISLKEEGINPIFDINGNKVGTLIVEE